MSEARDLRQAIAFERWWDRMLRGEGARHEPELDPGLEAFARRVHALDEQPTADPVFKRQLWEDLMNAQPAMALNPNTLFGPNGRPRSAPAAAIPRPIPRPRRPQGRLTIALSYAGAFALIAAMLAGIFFIYSDRQRAFVPAGQQTATAVASPAAGWPTMLGNNQRTAATGELGPVGAFSTLWTFKAPGGLNNVIVAGDAALLQSEDGALYCLDRMTGHQRWALDTGGVSDGNVRSYPAVDNGIVYAGGRTGDVMAIDAATGQIKWRVNISSDPIEASILVQEGVVYTGTGGGLFVALNATDGSTIWQFNDGQDFVNTFPAFDNGVIYVGGPQSVRAINASDGKLVWEARTDGQVRGAAVAGGVVYAPTAPGTIYALNEADGHQLWTRTFGDAAPGLSVAVSDGIVVAGFGTGGMMGLDIKTGNVVWQTPDSGGVVTASKVSIANGIAYAYFGPRGGMLAVDVKTGQERGFGATEEIRMPPSIVDGVLYAGSGAGIAYAFTSEGVTSTPQEQLATPVVASNAVPTAVTTPAAVPTVAAQPLPVKFLASFAGWEPGEHPLGLDLAPDGKIWVAVSDSTFAIFDLDGNLLETWGTPGAEPGQFQFTDGVGTVGEIIWRADGSFYVADLNGIQLFDKDRTFVKNIETGAGGSTSLSIDPDGTLWIGLINPDRIVHLDANGNELGSFDGVGTKSGRLHTPSPPAFDSQGRLYVAEQDSNRIRIFDRDGNELGILGQDDPGFPGIYRPFGVTIDANGMIYICDKDKVDVFDPSWHYLGWFGGGGTGDGQFKTADGVIVNGTKTIFVVDFGNNRIQKFAITGPWPVSPLAGTPAP